MHSHMRDLTYSVVRNIQQLSHTPLRFSPPRLTRPFCDDKKEKSTSVISESSVTPSSSQSAPVETPSHHAVRRELKRQKEDYMKQVKEIVAENDR